MSTVVHTYEPHTSIHWLEFTGKPDEDTRTLLKDAGWRWSGAAGQWKHPGLLTPLPKLPGYEFEEGGDVDHSEERAARYEERAEKHGAKGSAAYNTAHRISDFIPPGQPILVGHHSERRHRKDLARIDSNMRTAIDEGKKAEDLADRADAALAHKRHAESPGAIARKLDKLRNQYKVYEHATSEQGIRNRTLLTQEITRLEGALQDAGGLPIAKVDVQKGDVILMGHAIEVVRVNTKTISGLLINPVHNLFTKESGYTQRTALCPVKCDITEFRRRIFTAAEWSAVKAGHTQLEAYGAAQDRLKELKNK